MSTRAPLRVAVTFRHDSPSAMLLSQAAGDRYHLIWVIDSATASLGPLLRLLRRLGPVVDVAGLSREAATAALRAERPDAITTYSDDLLLATAVLAADLGLPYYDLPTAGRLVDKSAQRAALAAAGIPVPRQWVVPAGAGAAAEDEVAAVIDYPAVLKPRRGQGSRNTFLVEDPAGVRAVLDELGGPVRAFDVVVEQYLRDRPQGDSDFAGYLSVESVVAGGRVHHVATNGRFPPEPPFRESGFFIPSALADSERGEVVELAAAAARALGIERGCLHTEIKLTPDGPRIIEVNGRLGGGVSEMLSSISSVDLFQVALDVAAGCFSPPDLPPAFSGVGFLFYVQAPPGRFRVVRVEGLEGLGERPDVSGVFLNRRPGSLVDSHDGNHGYLYSVYGVATDHPALRRFARALPQLVRVELETVEAVGAA